MANSYLNRTVSSASNRRTFTFSAWIKRSKLGTAQSVIGADSGGGTNFGLQFQTNDTLAVFQGASTFLITTQVFRDTSAWYHLVLAVDTTNSTADNRVRLYNNGTEITSFGTRNNPSVNTDLAWNNNVDNTVGADKPTSGVRNYFDGYISHAANVDGQQLTPTSFGETDSTSGIWKFKPPSGITWGTNGFHLKFENSGALGTDSSGNSNTFTVNGNLKQALDTPSNSYSTFNPLDNSQGLSTITEGANTIATASSQYTFNTSTLGVSSGKWYCEVKVVSTEASGNKNLIGISNQPSTSTSDYLGFKSLAWAYNGNTGQVMNSGSGSSYGATYTTNDIIGIALDLDNNKLYFHKNGTYQNSGVPTSGSTGTGAVSITSTSSNLTGFYFICGGDIHNAGGCTLSANFGNGFFGTTAITSAGSNGNGSLFEYDVPSGYYALNTKNINTYG